MKLTYNQAVAVSFAAIAIAMVVLGYAFDRALTLSGF